MACGTSSFLKRAAWWLSAPGLAGWRGSARHLARAFLPTVGGFRPNFHVGEYRVLIQTATGRRWLLDAETGRTLDDAPSPEPWPTAPPALAEYKAVVIESGRRIVALEGRTGREVWTTTITPSSMVSGDPPQLRVARWRDTILVLTQTSLGARLQRLDANTGKPLWATMPLLAADTLPPTDWGLDKDAVYLPQGSKLIALSLADGNLLWEKQFPRMAASWRVSREGHFLIVHPARIPEWQFQFRSPFGAVQWGICLPPEERPGSGCPLLAFDPATGRIVQRWNFPAGPMRWRTYPAEPSLWPVVEVGQRSGDAGMTVISTRGGLVVTIGGQAWGLRARE